MNTGIDDMSDRDIWVAVGIKAALLALAIATFAAVGAFLWFSFT